MSVEIVAQVAQLGIGGVSLFLLGLVWQELKIQNQFNRKMLIDAAKERAVMMHNVMEMRQASGNGD